MVTHARAKFRGQRNADIWPGFVDGLATLLLVIVFLLSVFVLAQFFLSHALTGRDAALAELNQKFLALGELLDLERVANDSLRKDMSQLSATLQDANRARDEEAGSADRAEATIASLTSVVAERDSALGRLEDQAEQLERDLTQSNAVSAQALARIEHLNRQISALRGQLTRLEVALEVAERKDLEQKTIVKNLGQRLNQALAAKVSELAKYRSAFLARLAEVVGDKPGVTIEGDRFVFQSEVLFASGSAELEEDGKADLATIADILLQVAPDIPQDVRWVLRVDGHTDRVPISTARYPSNWELSAARAISVIRYLMERGLPPDRLVAAGFGQHHPMDPKADVVADQRNRRIELKLTER